MRVESTLWLYRKTTTPSSSNTKKSNHQLVNQSLYYLSWINDHRGDFRLAANRRLGNDIEIDWDEVRVICIAPGYRKFDLHAVQVMKANIELWQYRLFENGAFYLEEVFRRGSPTKVSVSVDDEIVSGDAESLTAGKKAAITRATGT